MMHVLIAQGIYYLRIEPKQNLVNIINTSSFILDLNNEKAIGAVQAKRTQKCYFLDSNPIKKNFLC